ncbi:hypothetical protein MWU59_07680 [Flavobacteriaceae bacterium F08102]|nr:hypothetical protein [Flavobacteriaceae bacterium F08102]
MKSFAISVLYLLSLVLGACSGNGEQIKTVNSKVFITKLVHENKVERVKVINNKEVVLNLKGSKQKMLIPLNSADDLDDIVMAIKNSQLMMPPIDRAYSSNRQTSSFFNLSNSIFLIILVAYLLFLTVIIDVLRSTFKSEIDKLI